ncbi:MAG: M18 family aminopeptidase [Candidatus Riflebacteria bacterium]|nr:M18 family aminopeptidase [Candidatus Riflebacteria bacterium]
MTDNNALAREFLDFSYSSPTAFHAILNLRSYFEQQGFTYIKERDDWNLTPGGKYFTTRNGSSMVAFIVGTKPPDVTGMKIAASHTDSPSFRIKPSPEWSSKDFYMRINTEVYGGPILSTWFDRPLAIAGRITVKSDNIFAPDNFVINIKKPIAIIPNIAIHLNRELNDGYVYDKQSDTLPFIGQLNNKLGGKGYLRSLLAEKLEVSMDETLDFELFLYEYEKGTLIGPNDEYISASRIDNLQSVWASAKALGETENPETTCVSVFFDNEEIGSTTRQGADSTFLSDTIERIVLSMKGNRMSYLKTLSRSFMLSIDGAHAVHPNVKEREDPTSRPVLNGGPVIKTSAAKRYTSDSYTSAIFMCLCEEAGVPYQVFANRSDVTGGSTLGPISAKHVSIPSVDIGAPVLAMHSIRELCGTEDNANMYKVIKTYYSSDGIRTQK